jgi:hypothetical protein
MRVLYTIVLILLFTITTAKDVAVVSSLRFEKHHLTATYTL